ncbi:RNA-directed DNA polymerase, eukaryota, reverse transcriptase zinc-binding domain protein [Tanacetum coccineum]
MSTKRRPKRKTRVPIKFNDTVCDLTQGKGDKVASYDTDGSNKAMEYDDKGGSGSNGSKEFIVTESEFPLLSEMNSMNKEGFSSLDLEEIGDNEKECLDAKTCEEVDGVRQENEVRTQQDPNNNHVDGMNSNQKENNDNQNCNIDNENEKCKTPTSKTLASIVKPNDDNGDNKLSQIPITIEEGREVVIFDDELILEGSRKWALTLCGHFVGFKMSYSELRYNLNGPWMVNNKPLMVQKWDPSIIMDKTEPVKLPCWIKLYNVPLEAWTTKGISVIASSLGNPLIMDKTTTKLCKEGTGNFGYARVLVEISADKEFKEKIEICYKSQEMVYPCSKFVKVEYSWKPQKCSQCKVFGHSDSLCSDNKNTERGRDTEVGQNGWIQGKNGKQSDEVNRLGNGDRNKNMNTNWIRNEGGKKLEQRTKPPRMEFRPVQKKKIIDELQKKSHTVNDQMSKSESSNPNQNTGSKSPWKVNKDVVEDIRRSANKFAILEEILESDDPEVQVQNEIDIVNKFVKNQRQPTLEESKNWSNKMFHKFKEQWEKTWNSECLDEEDVYDGDHDEGICNKDMQKEVKKFIKDEKLSICATLETHLKKKQMHKVCSFVFGGWSWVSNIKECDKGCRIIIGWNEEDVKVMVINSCKQAVLCLVEIIDSKQKFFCTFVYAANTGKKRKMLWRELCKCKSFIDDKPWVLMGDWNVSLNIEDHSEGGSCKTSDMIDFQECLDAIGIEDINCSGIHFTWVQSRKDPKSGVMKKIDRVLGNIEFMIQYTNSHAIFLPHLTSDHSPAILVLPDKKKKRNNAFRFSNFITDKPEFINVVQDKLNIHIDGCMMYKVVKKLKCLKPHMKAISWSYGNLHEKVIEWREKLIVAQKDIDKDPHNARLKKLETEILKEYITAKNDEDNLLAQKAKIDWLCDGDKNSKYFHNVIKGRAHRNRIEAVCNEKGERFEGDQIAEQFVKHFQSFLGNARPVQKFDLGKLKSKTVSSEDAVNMVRMVNDGEVKAALFDICDNKAPGPDGYTAKFYKKASSVVGKDMCDAIKEFFKNGKILGEVNATLITLVPKSNTPQRVSDYRPIACYNILLAQELLKGYNRKNGARRVALKIDIQKAYDTVNWDFLEECLHMFQFPNKMIEWIMVWFGYFKGGRGLRQGDPISPYIFTLVMEVFSLILKQQIKEEGKFKYHWGCKDLKISHLCFADDLLVLCYGNLKSVQVIKKAMDLFSAVTGLNPNIGKSTVFFGNVQNNVKQEILSILPFQVGSLPVSYLGVPLITKQLSYTDCKCLIDRVQAKVTNWLNKMLSYAGRLQLIASILSSMQVYWASVFILPKTVTKEIDRMLKGFLWCQGDLSKGKAKIAWKQVCRTKEEGGLGIKDLSKWNEVLMSKHLWNAATMKESIWVNWISKNRLKGASIWEIDCDNNASSGWKSILGLRDKMRQHIICKVGDGSSIFLWHDKWWGPEPLSKLISMDVINNEGLDTNAKITDMIRDDNEWNWPTVLKSNNILKSIPAPKLNNGVKDSFLWKTKEGSIVNFSTNKAWKDWRESDDKIDNSRKIAEMVIAEINYLTDKWDDIVRLMSIKKHNRSIKSVLVRIILAAGVYFIWTERNRRLFTSEKMCCKDLINKVVLHIRLKLASLVVKRTKQVEELGGGSQCEQEFFSLLCDAICKSLSGIDWRSISEKGDTLLGCLPSTNMSAFLLVGEVQCWPGVGTVTLLFYPLVLDKEGVIRWFPVFKGIELVRKCRLFGKGFLCPSSALLLEDRWFTFKLSVSLLSECSQKGIAYVARGRIQKQGRGWKQEFPCVSGTGNVSGTGDVTPTVFPCNIGYSPSPVRLRSYNDPNGGCGTLVNARERHVTWPHLEKKRTRLRLYTKSLEEYGYILLFYANGSSVLRGCISPRESEEIKRDVEFVEKPRCDQLFWSELLVSVMWHYVCSVEHACAIESCVVERRRLLIVPCLLLCSSSRSEAV